MVAEEVDRDISGISFDLKVLIEWAAISGRCSGQSLNQLYEQLR